MSIQVKIQELTEKIEELEARKKELKGLLEKSRKVKQMPVLEREIKIVASRLAGAKIKRSRLYRKQNDVFELDRRGIKIKYYAVVFDPSGSHNIFGPFGSYEEANKERNYKILSAQKKLNPVKRKPK